MLMKYNEIPFSDSNIAIARRLVWMFGYSHEGGVPAPLVGGRGEVDEEVHLCARGEKTALELAQLLDLVRNYGNKTHRSKKRVNALRIGITMLCGFWMAVTGEVPDGRFPDPAVGNRPAPNTAAGFTYIAMRAVGCQFTDRAFREHFSKVRDSMERDATFLRTLFDS